MIQILGTGSLQRQKKILEPRGRNKARGPLLKHCGQARVAKWIPRTPPKGETVGSSPTSGAIFLS